jgi:hypothetical protein
MGLDEQDMFFGDNRAGEAQGEVAIFREPS